MSREKIHHSSQEIAPYREAQEIHRQSIENQVTNPGQIATIIIRIAVASVR